MKKLVVFFICSFIAISVTSAQYSINKTKYDHRTYSYQVGDPYNTTVAGVTSLLIPGLGQMFSGEGGRGLAFLGGYAGCLVIYGFGLGYAILDYEQEGTGASGAGLMVIGALGAVTVNVWSIVDAVRVARVNNLAFRDQSRSSLNIHLNPYFGNPSFYGSKNNHSVPVGLSLKVNF